VALYIFHSLANYTTITTVGSGKDDNLHLPVLMLEFGTQLMED
jgi:hypothetical protein